MLPVFIFLNDKTESGLNATNVCNHQEKKKIPKIVKKKDFLKIMYHETLSVLH